MKRITAIILALVLMLTLCAAAPGRRLSPVTVSNKGVKLELPAERDYFEKPVTGRARSSSRGGAIYIMPKPQAGNGNLGTVRDGTELSILAEHGGFYFFELANGQQGWNGTIYFEISSTPEKKTDSSYSTVSDKGVELVMPAEKDYYESPVDAAVKSSRKGGAIYIMPKPQVGNGNLGTVKDGTGVYILAEHGGYYFFETEDGRMGWNGEPFFKLDGKGVKTAPYSTVSDKGVSLETPDEDEYFAEALVGAAKSSRKGGSIYIMPRPQPGNGNLGKLADGTTVYILAERGGYYFFETEDGRTGWNGDIYFEVDGGQSRKRGGGSGAAADAALPDGDYYVELRDVLTGNGEEKILIRELCVIGYSVSDNPIFKYVGDEMKLTLAKRCIVTDSSVPKNGGGFVVKKTDIASLYAEYGSETCLWITVSGGRVTAIDKFYMA